MRLETYITKQKERKEKEKKDLFEKYRLAGLAVRKKNAEERRKEREMLKKKGGRPKKRGPKKKRKRKTTKIVNSRPTFDFKIISVSNGKQNGYIGSFVNVKQAYNKIKIAGFKNINIDLMYAFYAMQTYQNIFEANFALLEHHN